MTRINLPAGLRMLAAEPAHDADDPWPRIQALAAQRQRDGVGFALARTTKQRRRVWTTAAAAVVVVVLGTSVALFANRPRAADAAEVLAQVEAEAVSVSAAGAGPCTPANADTQTTGGMIAIGSGDKSGGPPDGPVSAASATQLSDKLAQALGVSGDKVRQAMRETVSGQLLPRPPADPIAGIARQLGVSTDQVCAAFFSAQSPGIAISGGSSDAQHVKTGERVESGMVLAINGTPINLNTATADELSGQAEKLGVTPERLLAAVKASIPSPPPAPPTPPSEDEIISRFAQNLGMSQDKVRAAIIQVEGPNQFYFAVPIPSFGKSS